MRFIRFQGDLLSERTGRPMGIFGVAHKLKLAKRLTPEQERTHAQIVQWCEGHLPNPPFYAQGNPEGYVTWFKETATEVISKMDELQSLIENSGAVCEKVIAAQPGAVVYEDKFQIAVKEPTP